MPISLAFAESNRIQTERLKKLVQQIPANMFQARLSNGWTISGILGHIAFWDRQRLCLMRRWASGNMCNGGYDGNLFNEAMQPLLELIPPDRGVKAVIEAAEEVDAFLLEVSDDVVQMALSRPDAPNLDRGSHREGHLDQIEQALTEAGISLVR